MGTMGVLLGASPVWLAAAGWGLAVGAGLLAAFWAVYQVGRLLLPKLTTIALGTAKEGMAQPLFYVLLFVGATAILAFPFIPYNTFGEDIKMLKDQGMTLIMILAIVQALWTASVSIAEEIEGRTALTLLSKPITRRQFILGKFLGILGPVLILFIVLGTLFVGTVAFKVVYEARENAQPPATTGQCIGEMLQVVPGLILAFLETVVLTSISVAISTRLPMLSNLLICASVYVLGHLAPLLVQSVADDFEIVGFVGRLLSIVLPNLDHFNIQAAISTGQPVPWEYLAWVLLYCVIYSAAALLVALLLFEDRDLA